MFRLEFLQMLNEIFWFLLLMVAAVLDVSDFGLHYSGWKSVGLMFKRIKFELLFHKRLVVCMEQGTFIDSAIKPAWA